MVSQIYIAFKIRFISDLYIPYKLFITNNRDTPPGQVKKPINYYAIMQEKCNSFTGYVSFYTVNYFK